MKNLYLKTLSIIALIHIIFTCHVVSQDTSLPVGSTSGSFAVSQGGKANYSIPVFVSPGTAGAQPTLTFEYNSSGAQGLMGMGWSLSGFSSISRSPQNIYNDGQVQGILFNASDRFDLDGNRLIATSAGNYGADATEYHTESETFCRITSYGSSGTGPRWFKVETKDGHILEYGNTDNSYFQVQGRSEIFSWHLNKMTDANGNYITYTYHYDYAKREFWPEKIEYTGNLTSEPALVPYNTIMFDYETKPDANVTYIAGASFVQNKRLSKVRVLNEGQLVRAYELTYQTGSFSKLSNITEIGRNGLIVNPTTFDWGGEFATDGIVSQAQSVGYVNNLNGGDFNGDGKTELLVSTPTGWSIYQNNGTSLSVISQTPYSEPLMDHDIVDVDNDGNDDIMGQTTEFVSYECNCRLCLDPTGLSAKTVMDSTVQPSLVGKTETSGFTFSAASGIQPLIATAGGVVVNGREDEMCCDLCEFYYIWHIWYKLDGSTLVRGADSYDLKSDYNLYKKDLDGDGQVDNILLDGSKNIFSIGLPTSGALPNFNTPYDVQFIDFNGNGKMDILVTENSAYGGSKIYEYNSSTHTLDVIYSQSFPLKNQPFYTGDFNGDGNTDLLAYQSGWKIYFSSGTNFISSPVSLSGGPSSDLLYTVADFNNDGKSDIIGLEDVYDGIEEGGIVYSTSWAHIYYYNGTSFTSENIEMPDLNIKDATLYTYDTNGDGLPEIWAKWPGKLKMITPHFTGTNRIISITNGLGNTTSITYKPLTDASVYTKQASATYPISNYISTEHVVASVQYDNGKNGHLQEDYFYEGGKYNKQVGYFMGFEKTTCTNQTTGIRKINTSEINNTFYFLAPKKQETIALPSTPVSEVNYTNSVKDYGNKRYFSYTVSKTAIDYIHNSATVSNTYSYDDYGNLLTASTDAGGIATSSVINTYVAAGAWCNNRLLTSSATMSRSGEADYTTTASFDYLSNGNLNQKITEPGNNQAVYSNYDYNDFGNVTALKTSPDGIDGRTVTYQYDPYGRVLTKTLNDQGHFVENDWDYGLGVITQQKDHNNLTVTSVYDDLGSLSSVNSPTVSQSSSRSWETSVSPENSRYYTISAVSGSPDVKTWYDRLGRPLLSESTGFDGRKLYVETAYNDKGQVSYVTLPYYEDESNTARKEYTYNALGQVTSETAPGLDLSYTYNGLSVKVTDNIKGQSYTRESDASGALVKNTDAGGDITYTYNSAGQVREVSAVGATTTMTYDQFGRQLTLTDPNTGTTTYGYNVYGELTSQADTFNSTILEYNNIGRIVNSFQPTFYTNYTYKPSGLTDVISGSNGVNYSYGYDPYLRPTSKTEDIMGDTYTTSLEYDENSRMSIVTYPSDFAVTYHYTHGILDEIKKEDGTAIWKLNAINSKGQVTEEQFGNGMVTTTSYNTEGRLTNINTVGAQNLEYVYNSKGLLESRSDYVHNTSESFRYDGLNRLNAINGAPITYAANGNIQSTSENGAYTYATDKVHALVRVDNLTGAISTQEQNIEYTSFHKVESIAEGSNSANFTYGPDFERKRLEMQVNGSNITRVYSGDYEYEDKDGDSRELYYIRAYGKIVAIFERKSGAENMFYVHSDMLGSLNVITDDNQEVLQDVAFDAWGNRVDPYTLQKLTGEPAGLITSRGFTGHEHMDAFGLINMNGRMYDPEVGRFLSADPFVANPSSTQDYNRYSYCVNNPFLFTDPSGYKRRDMVPDPVGKPDVPDYSGIFGSIFGRSAGGGGGSLFPQMGKNGIHNLADYDAQLKLNFDIAAGKYDQYAGQTVTVTTDNYIDYYNQNDGTYSGTRYVGSTISKMFIPDPNNTKAGILLFGKEGCGHAFVYDPSSGNAYEVGFPNRCDKNYLKALKKGLPSIGYKYINALTSKDFWGTCPDATRTNVDFALVLVPDKAAAIAFYESYVGKNWDWEPWGTCKNFVLEGFVKGGTDPKFNRANIRILPCDFSEPFTIHYNNPFLKK